MTTTIESLNVDHEDEVSENEENEDSKLIITDMSRSLSSRIRALELFYREHGEDETLEFINRLTMMYELSGTKLLKQYLTALCKNSRLSIWLKTFSAKALCSFLPTEPVGYECLADLYPKLPTGISTVIKIEMVKIMLNHACVQERAFSYFLDLVKPSKLSSNYRYKLILGLEHNNETENVERIQRLMQQAFELYLQSTENELCYRILAGQYLLLKKYEVKQVQTLLLEIATNTSIDYNLRADATDVLLQLGEEDVKVLARELIMSLGNVEQPARSLYQHSQNVHMSSIEESVVKIIEFLTTIPTKQVKNVPITFSYVKKYINRLVTSRYKKKQLDEHQLEKIKVALNRIGLDRALYSRFNYTLGTLLVQVWSYIARHADKKEMKKRLLEELQESATLCSSGYATRLVNVLSGFGDVSITISYTDQIIARFTILLNRKIMDLEDTELQGRVLEQMVLESHEFEKRIDFLKVLRENLPSIIEELWQEFCRDVTKTDYDLALRRALQNYETGSHL